jgi:hypothetical protein
MARKWCVLYGMMRKCSEHCNLFCLRIRPTLALQNYRGSVHGIRCVISHLAINNLLGGGVGINCLFVGASN